MKGAITVVDYEIGNLFNLKRAFEHLECACNFVQDVDSIRGADRLVVPGVGAFGAGITNLKNLGVVEAIKAFATTGKPLIGICLGMQLLMTRSEELGQWNGIDAVAGDVLRFKDGTGKLPQITWNSLEPACSWEGTILQGIPPGSLMYFNHSYYVQPNESKYSIATTPYAGINFTSVMRKDNVFGCQFHPERSSAWGLRLLSNFARLSF